MQYGYIYVAGAGDDRVKIGFSNRPDERVRQLETGAGQPIHLLVWMPGTRGDERALHDAFEDDRLHGEWFHLSDDLRRFVNSAATVCCRMSSWMEMQPFPRRGKIDEGDLRSRFGANAELVEMLADMGSVSAKLLMTQLVVNDRIAPAGEAMAYGLRAAISKGVASHHYVVRCAEYGVADGLVAS